MRATTPNRPPVPLWEFARRRRTATVTGVPLVLLIFGHPSSLGMGVGMALVALGQLVRFWSAGYIHKDAEVATGGPYAHVRNPLYVGSFLISAGLATMAGGWWPWLVIGLQFGVVYHLTVLSEERYLEGILGQPYRDYVASVPRWVPSLRRYGKPGGSFNVRQIGANKEWGSAALIAILCALFALKMLWISH
jgi:hypothetical protein